VFECSSGQKYYGGVTFQPLIKSSSGVFFFPTTNKTVTELPGVLNFLVHPTCQIKVNLYHYFNCKKNCCSSSLEPQQHPHQAVAFFRYAMRSARSCGFFSPGNTILVPGMYCIEKTQ
jgi:hypothetical protein